VIARRRGVSSALSVSLALGLVLTFAAPASAVTKDVSIEGFAFDPVSVTAAMGVTLRWTNSQFDPPHTATSDDPLPNGKPGLKVFDTGAIDSGATAQRTLPWAATYPYYCKFHFGMDARVATRMAITEASPGRYRVTWARADPRPGVEFQVQVKAPGGQFANLYRGTGHSRLFTPDADGTYEFHSRLVKMNGSAVAASTLYSPIASVTVG
jgi:plastocyanin